ncbi:MAG TPA: acyltransferase [Candidatus Acidoferrales bacterium]|nr:acyltransferase [Candidatus Acidoferrales bacterium]
MIRRGTGWGTLAKIGGALATVRRNTPGIPMLKNAMRGINWLYWRTCLGSLGERTEFFKGVTIHHAHRVHIGSSSSLNDYVQMWGQFGVTIGNDVLIAAHVVITSATHDANSYPYSTKVIGGPVVIEDGVWIGSGAIILPGVRIGARSIIGAGAVVTKDVAAGVIAVGTPARVLRSIPFGQEAR